MVDSTENILVDFDYNNITVIDPNKIIDEFGKAKERLVKHENLVMYANLECKVLPRTKLLVGASNADNLRTISSTDINFLNPGFTSYLNTNWTDEITGKDTVTGEGVNQRKLNVRELVSPDKTSKFYYSQSTSSKIGGETKASAIDNGMLGIKTIQVQYGSDFLPIITMRLEDVKGRTLFEAGNDSPYAAFFNLPYPQFFLTLKGYYGKAIKLPLQLQDFTCSYNPSTSNFEIDLKFYTYKFTVLSEVNFASMLAVPYMYNKNIQVTQKTNQQSGNATTKKEEVFYGYQKVKELYSEYKSKGLIPKEFPELTIQQMKYKLDQFIQDILNSFIKSNLAPLTNVQDYIDKIVEYQQEVYYFNSGTKKSWHNTYNNKKRIYVLKNNRKIFPYKAEVLISDAKKTSADNELKAIIDRFNNDLSKNKTLGKNGFYEINGKRIDSEIQNTIEFKDLFFDFGDFSPDDINYDETFKILSGGTTPTQSQIDEILDKFTKDKGNSFNQQDNSKKVWYFEGTGSFLEKTDKIIKLAEIKKDEISTNITKALFEIIKNDSSGLGFVPTIRNVTSVLFANIEAYLRLLEEVHTKAWEKRDSSVRKRAIFSVNTAGANPDVLANITNIQDANINVPVYPWPEFLIETSGENGEEKFQPKYPNDESVRSQTGADNWEEWPEVEFVEEYVNGLTKRDSNIQPTAASNEALDSQRLSVNAIEFPANNQIFNNLEEVKFFYEIYERLIVASFYSKFTRSTLDNNDLDKIAVSIAESEKLNIINSLREDSYFLKYKLKNYKFNQSNYLPTLQHFSNNGVGESWQNFIRGIFNTSYLKNEINNDSYSIFYEKYNPKNVLGQNINAYDISNLVSFESEKNIVTYMTGSSSTKKFDLTDLFPFTDEDWCRKNLAGPNPITPASVNFINIINNTSPITEFYDTSKSLFYNTALKTVTNYTTPGEAAKPIINYNFKNSESDYFNVSNPNNTTTFINNLSFLDKFYQARNEKYSRQYPTEGNLNYDSRPGLLTRKQTVSILNTPYFINSIQKGVQKFRNFDKYPYLVPAYLFLNSLPFATLRDRFTKFSQSTPPNSTQPIQSVEQLNYIFPTFRKFGAIHQLPYGWILKIGSIWHRYKKWIETGVDILDECWTDFNYVANFDPDTSASTKTYSLTLSGGQNVDITLEQETIIGQQVYTQINTGFYPQLINDFSVFLQGYNVINPYITVEGVGFFTGDTNNTGGVCTISSIKNNILGVNTLIKGPGIISDTIITGQLSGPTGGPGVYTLNIPQTAGTVNFTATNFLQPGYTSTVVQAGIDLGLQILNSPQSNYTMNFSGDSSNLNRYIQMNAWSVYVNDRNGRDCYILPSHGASLNQAALECFENGKKKFEVSGNTSIYNGSVRTFWNAPNYGFFDVNRIIKPKPDEYMKTVFGGFLQQENFSLNNSPKYTKMSEILTAFDKKVLDEFENKFLAFSQDRYSFKNENLGADNDVEAINNSNFHSLFIEMMRVNVPPTGLTQTDTIFDLQKKQATKIMDKVGSFMKYTAYFKYGNPSNYDKLNFETFSNRVIENRVNFERYSVTTKNALPDGVNGQTLVNSRIEYDIEWKTLLTHVGFSEIPGIQYSDNGSTIFDFFIDFDVAFNEINIISFSPLIKMYATQKKRNSNVDGAVFSNYMDKYLNDGDLLINKTLDNLFIQLQKDIEPINVTNSRETNPTVQGEQTKLELYQTFKATNDKWISGTDFNRKTLFEDILFLDRSNKDLGQKVIVDIVGLSSEIDPKLMRATANSLDMISNIVKANKFEPLFIPGYVNYYGIDEVSADAVPKPEGSLDLANTLFGTFTSVDYRESSTKLLCYYGGASSKHLDKEGALEGFKNDSFDLRRATDNPLVENQSNKKDWATSNKVVGFNVDIGPQNQGIFKSFQVSQKNSTPTAEGLQILSEMSRQAGNRGFATQNLSLYDLYKVRSYECSVTMLGNVLIQPLMYFNLRYVPMFSGPYLITNISHSISSGDFQTTFKGVRQPVASFSSDVGLIQSLKTNLVDNLIKDELKKIKDQKDFNKNPNNIKKKTQLISQATQTLSTDASMTCTADTAYTSFTAVTNPVKYEATINDIVKKIELIGQNKGITGDNYNKLKYSIFAKIWLENRGKLLSVNAKGIERNFSGVELTKNWGSAGATYFVKKFFCAERNSSEGPKPFAIFEDLDKNIEFLYDIWKNLSKKIKDVNNNDEIATLILTKGYEESLWKSLGKAEQDSIMLDIANAKRAFDDVDSV